MKDTLLGVDVSLLLGVCACAAAALASARAGRAPLTARSPWYVVAAIQGAFALELLIGGRYQWHDAALRWLRSHDEYAGREPLQAALIAAVAALVLVVGVVALRLVRRDRSLALALGASAVMAGLLLVEAVSLHAVDALMYRRLGPVVWVAWAWAATAVAVIAAAVAAIRDRAP